MATGYLTSGRSTNFIIIIFKTLNLNDEAVGGWSTNCDENKVDDDVDADLVLYTIPSK